MHDTELRRCLERVRGGDREAFSEIYRDLSGPVYTVIWRIVCHRELAEDLTQDLFVKLFCSPPEPSVKSPRAWIFRMARNLAIDALRTRHTSQSEELLDGIPAENETARSDLQMDVAQAMSRLSQTEREIVALRIWGELGFAEIARTVGLSLSAVWRVWHRALNRLREELGG